MKIDIYACQHNDVVKKENHRLTSANCAMAQHISDFCRQNYQV